MAMGKPQVAFDLDEMQVSAGDSAVYAKPNDPEDFGRENSGSSRRPGAPRKNGPERT